MTKMNFLWKTGQKKYKLKRASPLSKEIKLFIMRYVIRGGECPQINVGWKFDIVLNQPKKTIGDSLKAFLCLVILLEGNKVENGAPRRNHFLFKRVLLVICWISEASYG